jgi:integrase/recombinase XerD
MGSYVRGVIDSNYRQPNSASSMTEQAIGPLRRGMIDGVTIGRFAQKTEHDYAQRVKDFASYLKPLPIQPSRKMYVAFSCIWRRAAPAFPRLTPEISVLRFFFKVTFDRRDFRGARP